MSKNILIKRTKTLGKLRFGPVFFSVLIFFLVLAEGVFYIHLNNLISEQTFEIDVVNENLVKYLNEKNQLEAESAKLSSFERINKYYEEKKSEFVKISDCKFLQD